MIDIPTRVKDALKSGIYRKNYNILIYDDDDGNVVKILDNNNLIQESVLLDERMCSGKNLKFGLCEGSSLEFQYFNYENINGKRIQLILDVEYLDSDNVVKWYSMPMGFFDVDSCPMQFSTGIRKATCYNKLRSDYLDRDATILINELVKNGELGVKNKITLYKLIDELLQGYRIDVAADMVFSSSGATHGYKVDTKIIDNLYRNDGYGWYKVDYPLYVYVGSFDIYTGNPFPYPWENYLRWVANIKKMYDGICRLISAVYNFGKEVDDGNIRQLSIIGRKGMYDDVTDAFGIKIAYYDKDDKLIRTSGNLLLGDDIQKDALFNKGLFYYRIELPFYASLNRDANYVDALQRMEDWFDNNTDSIKTERKYLSEIEKIEITPSKLEKVQEISLRNLQSSVFELNCQFGQLDRETDLFRGIYLNNDRLLPSESLYPSNALVPVSNAENTPPSSYEKLWTDSAGVQKFRYLFVYYKGIVDGQEKDCVLQRTVNENGTQDYSMSDNWLLKNFVWTEAQVSAYAETMVDAMRNVTWFPFEMWSAGLPWIETGDEIEVTTSEGTYTSYILQRQLKGIQMLLDTFVNGELDIF